MRAAFALVAAIAACGYRPVNAVSTPERLHVVLVRSTVPDAAAADEVTAGIRDTLAQEGALAVGGGYPRLEVEVLRADDATSGIAAGPTGPVARGASVGLLARAWLVRSPSAPRERDTGDMRAFETVAQQADPRASLLQQGDALRAAARRVGQSLALRILGFPTPTDDRTP